jgi:hypothetical protein
MVLVNFSDQPQTLDMARFRTYGMKSLVHDLIKEEEVNLARPYALEPYQFLWLMPESF